MQLLFVDYTNIHLLMAYEVIRCMNVLHRFCLFCHHKFTPHKLIAILIKLLIDFSCDKCIEYTKPYESFIIDLHIGRAHKIFTVFTA